MKIYENETIITKNKYRRRKKVYVHVVLKWSLGFFLSIFNQKQLMQKMHIERRFKNDSFWLNLTIFNCTQTDKNACISSVETFTWTKTWRFYAFIKDWLSSSSGHHFMWIKLWWCNLYSIHHNNLLFLPHEKGFKKL